MNISQLVNTRLSTQQIAGTGFTTPASLVNWMGAMQAQDYAMAKWAVGIRLGDTTEKKIEQAIDKGQLIRTHVLRPTWHFVAAADIHWMLSLTAPNIKALLKSREKELELSESLFRKANKIMEKVLRDGNHLVREDLVAQLERSTINCDNQRSAHILLRAELEGLLCSGTAKSKKHSYALLDERVPIKKKFDRKEALAMLAQKYFQSHGPATLQDFSWWSGLSMKDARMALEMIPSHIIKEVLGSQAYWFGETISFEKSYRKSVYPLPAFDEFIISYKDRSAMLSSGNHQQAVSMNGIFRPTIVVNGKVMGTWSRTFRKEKGMITVNFFRPVSKSLQQTVIKSFKGFRHFLDKEMEVRMIMS